MLAAFVAIVFLVIECVAMIGLFAANGFQMAAVGALGFGLVLVCLLISGGITWPSWGSKG